MGKTFANSGGNDVADHKSKPETPQLLSNEAWTDAAGRDTAQVLEMDCNTARVEVCGDVQGQICKELGGNMDINIDFKNLYRCCQLNDTTINASSVSNQCTSGVCQNAPGAAATCNAHVALLLRSQVKQNEVR